MNQYQTKDFQTPICRQTGNNQGRRIVRAYWGKLKLKDMDNWHEIYITDKSGKRFWNTHASAWSKQPEINNLKNHLKQAAEHPELYRFLDVETAHIVIDGERLQTLDDIDLSLLDDLGI